MICNNVNRKKAGDVWEGKGPKNCKKKISEQEGGKVKQAVGKIRQEVNKATGNKRKNCDS